MRIATWNVNSLKARQDKVEGWLERAAPDVLLMQETKLGDDDAPVMAFAMAGYDLVHHGEGRWNGVAIAVRQGLGADEVVTNFGDGPVRDSGPGAAVAVSEEDFDPFDEARMVSAVVDPAGRAGGPIRFVSLYGPNGRVVGSPFFDGKLRWFERLERWLREARSPDEPLVLGGDFNIAPTDEDVWDPAAVHGGTHVSAPERAAFDGPARLGPGRWLPVEAGRAGTLHVVGLPGRQLPQEPRDADRSPAADPAARRPGRLGRDRPRGPQGTADPVGPCPAGGRPRRSGPAPSTRTGPAPWPGSPLERDRRPGRLRADRLPSAVRRAHGRLRSSMTPTGWRRADPGGLGPITPVALDGTRRTGAKRRPVGCDA